MPILVKLDDMLHARRMTLTELADRVGITLANLSILKTGKARAVRFSTLDAICEALQCQPGDLLEHAKPVADEVTAAAPDSPLLETRFLRTVEDEA
jgi:putative transcriptional regulator